MVVNRGGSARQPHPSLQFTTVLLIAASSGCAAPWLKTANETELPLVDSQAPKVYAKTSAATPDRASDAKQSRPAPSETDMRMAREIERLTQLNNQLSTTIGKSAAAAAPRQAGQNPTSPVRSAGPKAIGHDPQSEFVELDTAKVASGATVKGGLAQSTFNDDVDSGEQAPAPIVEKSQLTNEVKLESPQPADQPNPTPEEGQRAYQAGDWLKARDEVMAQLRSEIEAARLDKDRVAEVGHLETLLRMHYALAGRRDEAVKPVKELREQEQEFWRSEALGLADLLGNDRLANESRRYAVALKSLEEAESHLAAAGSLALRNIALCRKVQDFGVIERFKTHDFTRNQEVLLYVEVRNFTAKQKEDHLYETELQGSFRVLDRSGIARAERTLPLDKQTCANLRRDYYIAYRLYIPSELAPGSYTLELTIEDKKGSKSNNALLDFNVTQ